MLRRARIFNELSPICTGTHQQWIGTIMTHPDRIRNEPKNGIYLHTDKDYSSEAK
jgi:hypothetical protein